MNEDSFQDADPRVVGAQPSTTPALAGGSDEPTASLREVKDVARDQARNIADEIKHETNEAMHSAKEAGEDFMREQTRKVAEKIEQYNEAVYAACERLEGGEENLLAGPAHRAARQLERASAYLRTHDPMDMVHDLSDFARRRPEIIFGGMFVVGLASVRFLKASARDHRRNGNGNGSNGEIVTTDWRRYPESGALAAPVGETQAAAGTQQPYSPPVRSSQPSSTINPTLLK